MGVLLALRGIIAFIPAFVWKWLAIATIAVVLFFAGDVRGRRIEHEKNLAAIAAAQKAADAQDDAAQDEVSTQDTEVTKQLMEQKKVDDAHIEALQRQLTEKLAEQPPKTVAGKTVCPPVNACVYDKSNADPDDAGADRVRDNRPARSGARDKKAPRSTVVPPAGSGSTSKGGKLSVRGVGTAQAGNR